MEQDAANFAVRRTVETSTRIPRASVARDGRTTSRARLTMGSMREAMLGAREAWKKRKGAKEKAKFALHVVRMAAAELVSTAQLAPYAARAWWDREASDVGPFRRRGKRVRVWKGVPYAADSRQQRVDVYLPTDVNDGGGSTTRTKRPAALFVHGGTWSSGCAWHYAPMARRLAEHGVVVAVADYRLYPNATMEDMTQDVLCAMRWTVETAPKIGADPERVAVVGHSAGAHLVAKALLLWDEETKAMKDRTKQQQMEAKRPSLFVGLAGVYDIQKHYEYEAERNVHELSTMARAMGGPSNFKKHSPALHVMDVLKEHFRKADSHLPPSKQDVQPAPTPTQKLQLFGEGIAARIGLAQPLHWANTVLPEEPLLRFPPTVLAGSFKDVVVPWYQSAEFALHLHRAGIPTRQLVYDNVGHGNFVVDWWSSSSAEELPHHSRDLLALLQEGNW